MEVLQSVINAYDYGVKKTEVRKKLILDSQTIDGI